MDLVSIGDLTIGHYLREKRRRCTALWTRDSVVSRVCGKDDGAEVARLGQFVPVVGVELHRVGEAGPLAPLSSDGA